MQDSLLIHIALRQLKPEQLAGLNILPLDQQDLAVNAQRRTEQLISRTERRQILTIWLNQSAASLCFAKDSYGKPYLLDQPELQFSQSHCREQFLLAFNQQGVAVGVDIEAKRRIIANVNGLAQRILTATELEFFDLADNPREYLLKRWTVKEAILKACGLGIRLNLNLLETEHENTSVKTMKLDAKENKSIASITIKKTNPAHIKLQKSAHTAYHPAIGEWAYQCFETEDYYYTVAWQQHPEKQDLQQVSFHWLA